MAGQFKYFFAAIDGLHCPIRYPADRTESMKQYYNFKNLYSVLLLTLVDTDYRFIWANIVALGNKYYSIYFQSTLFWEKITKGELIPNKIQTVDHSSNLKFLVMVRS